jgi:anti-sigma B factor antagonist
VVTFHTEEVEFGTATMLSFEGELDLAYGPTVNAAVEHALARRPAAFAADLRGVTFMDSSGIHTLISAERRCRLAGVRFFLIRGSAAIDVLLTMVGLDRLFEILSGPEQIPRDLKLTAAA